MKRLAVLIAFALVLAPGKALAAAVPTLEFVREHIRAASGTEPPSERTVTAFDEFGLHGTRTNVRVGSDFRETVVEGPFTSARGRLHGQRWHQNRNGETVLDQPDPGIAVREAYQATVSEISAPVTGYMLASLNKAGQGTKEYVESATWRIVRRDVITASGTTTYAYDDFRTTGGYTKPWHWTARDGQAENDTEDRIQTDEAGPQREADLAIPSSRRNLVDFPAGKNSIGLPVRYIQNKFYVRVDIGGKGYDFLLDTGASGIVIDDATLAELGLKTYGAFSNAANAGRYKSTSSIVPEMKIGDLTLHDVVVGTIPHFAASDRPGMLKMTGLLGFDFIASVVLRMDYEHGQLFALDPASFAPPKDRMTDALFVRLSGGIPVTDVKINGALGERFGIDTGGGGGVLIFDYFARRHPEALVDTSGGMLATRHLEGVGGGFETRRYRLDSVQIGNVNFKQFNADVVTSAGAYGFALDGIIGVNLLKFYTLYTDYGNSMLYLVPNSLGRAGFEP